MEIEDPEVIRAVEERFHPKVYRRHHPGHKMLVEFAPPKDGVKPGKPAIVTLRITNIGDKEFTFMQGGRQRGPRDNQFAFSAEKLGNEMLPDIGDPRHFGGLAGYVTVKPGEVHEIKVDLRNWFNFQSEGMYQLRGSYYMQLVENPSEFNIIWEDFACAEFVLTVKN